VQLFDSGTSIALLKGTAIEDFTRQVNPRIWAKARLYHPTDMSAETALSMLLLVLNTSVRIVMLEVGVQIFVALLIQNSSSCIWSSLTGKNEIIVGMF